MAINFLKVRNGFTLKPTTAPSTPENGDFYYDSGSNSFQLYQNGVWISIPTTLVTTVGSFDGQAPSANGLVIASTSIYAQSASATVPGMVNTTTQSFAGNKTFTGTISASNLSGTNTGDQTITLTGDVTGSGTSSFSTTIASGVVTNTKLATMPAFTIKANNSGSTASPGDVNVAGINTMLGTVTTVGALDGQTFSANGAAIAGNSIYMQSAAGTGPGLLTGVAQSVAGAKTFTGSVTTPTQKITGSVSGTVTIQAASTVTDYTIKWPDSQAPATGYVPTNDGSGNLSWTVGSIYSPTWVSQTFTFASFSTAALTNTISLYTLPSNTMLHEIIIKHSAPMAGGGLTSYTVSVGAGGNNSLYAQPFDVKQANSNTARSITQIDDVPNFGGTTNIQITATSTGTNLNNVTSGTFQVWLLVSLLHP